MSNIFEVDNARNEGPEVLAKNFVWMPAMRRLMTPKNHIVLGARGSGKTAIAKMLSHAYLARSSLDSSKAIIAEKSFIGCYVPLRLEWVSSLSNKTWLNDADKDAFFSWRLNLTSCLAFLKTVESCVHAYTNSSLNRIIVERKIASILGGDFGLGGECFSFAELTKAMERFEFLRQQEYLKARYSGGGLGDGLPPSAFDVPLFDPVRRMISILRGEIRFPEGTIWAICLDEAEFLDVRYQVILNSNLRTESSGLHFKIFTMPYKHLTMKTLSNVSLTHGDDFDYVYIDNGFGQADNREQRRQEEFVKELFANRLRSSGRTGQNVFDLVFFLGNSELISDEESSEIGDEKFFDLLERHADPACIRRAKDIKGTKEFGDQIYRKIKAALKLKEMVSRKKGNEHIEAYSGFQMLVRCSDGNPRRAIGLLNKLIQSHPESLPSHGMRSLQRRDQHMVFKKFSAGVLSRVKGEYAGEVSVYEFVSAVGQVFRARLHAGRISTDQYVSFDFDGPAELFWEAVEAAVGLGLVYPIVNASSPDQLPIREGKFYLAYALSPNFDLLPRKGKSMTLSQTVHEANRRGLSGLMFRRQEQIQLI